MNILSRSRRWIQHRLCLVAAAAPLIVPALANAETTVVEMTIDGAIGAATAEYVISGLEHAKESGADLVILNMDTPGGLMNSMSDMIEAILSSPVPVVSYVTPPGGQAASAGTFILLASHIAAMAPTTRTGAATPVSITGGDVAPSPPESDSEDSEDTEDTEDKPLPGTAMERKVMNDSVAYIRSLAERYGRNADWAEKAVTEAVSLTAKEALEQNVIDIVAVNREDLLKQIDGRQVTVLAQEHTISTTTVTIEEFEKSWRVELLSILAEPAVILLLGLVGVYGLMYEGWNPGALVPGIVGVICLLLAAYATQIVPVNYAGVALILLGIALMVAEAFAPSFGALGLGGIAAFVFGAIMMFDSGVPGYGVSIGAVVSIAVAAALFLLWVISYTVKLRNRGAVSGQASILGGRGTAISDFTGDGKIWLEGESWHARSSVPIHKDQEVIVTAMDGLVLLVKPSTADNPEDAALQT